jgi:hypothetical protein
MLGQKPAPNHEENPERRMAAVHQQRSTHLAGVQFDSYHQRDPRRLTIYVQAMTGIKSLVPGAESEIVVVPDGRLPGTLVAGARYSLSSTSQFALGCRVAEKG